ncbi:MAG: hypothetical protein N2C14_25010 [Planctomycetales bacterium]
MREPETKRLALTNTLLLLKPTARKAQRSGRSAPMRSPRKVAGET